MDYPLISIIIPAYNHEFYIRQCLESVVSQDYPNLELIIINDGSTDETSQRISDILPICRSKFKNVIFIDKKNEGVTKTLNLGVGLAKGEFIVIIASDDYVAYTYSVSILYKSFLDLNDNENKYAGISSDMSIVDEKGNKVLWNSNQENVSVPGPQTYDTTVKYFTHWRNEFDGFDYKSENFGTYASILVGHYMPNCSLLKRNAIQEMGLYNEDLSVEDWDMWLKLTKKYKFAFIETPLFCCRWHSQNAQKKIKSKIVQDIYKLVYAQKSYCLENDMYDTWYTAFKLSRSNLANNGEVAFLFEQSQTRMDLYIVEDFLMYLIHKLKRLLKQILPEKSFLQIKNFWRKIMTIG